MIASTKGFMRWAGLILAVSMALISTQAHAVTVTVGGTSYELVVVNTSFNADNADTQLLQGQDWWGNSSLASDFANAFAATGSSPTGYSYFAFGESIIYDPFGFDPPETQVQAYFTQKVGQSEITGLAGNQPYGTFNYVTATASPSSVPEINAGSLSQALLMLFALWLVTWRRTGSRVA